MKKIGLLLVAAALALPFVWWPQIAQGRDGIALFSQYLGLGALIAMAISHLIATRWPGVELVFGPMDQSYRLHKWLGIGAMVAILLHDTIDAEMRGLGRETALVELAETLGEISLYGLLMLVVITVATFIPYHLWKWTHRFIGIFFLFGAFHYLYILKPFKNSDPLGLYMWAVCIIGTVAYAWTSAPRGMRPRKSYEITAVTQEGDAIAVDMKPTGRPLRHRAGQFAFFRFSGAGLNEPHPFTISSAPADDGTLRITVAPLGDLTNRVSRSLAVGQALQADGPYGHFGRAKGAQVWIAAGVGITPFVALAQALPADAAPVTLVYCVRDRANAPHLAELEALAAAKPNLTLVLWQSAERGRFTADALPELVDDIATRKVLFCGPVPMRRALSKDLPKQGVSQRNFHYEAFEIRTGIGIRRLAEWLWQRHQARSTS
ncbi:MAG: ferredoxin reductase family protein [Shimia sp.]|uniref:ferredoxin reductase family protein n=1 Tax=Shimia sp. TaxID=1954381 RepID=UPI001B29D8CC|nr:ferredoxin reductase family protein [Shimia sp.]MBO6896548.1 ferredoxin reductase family protein [Shimia sp.]